MRRIRLRTLLLLTLGLCAVWIAGASPLPAIGLSGAVAETGRGAIPVPPKRPEMREAARPVSEPVPVLRCPGVTVFAKPMRNSAKRRFTARFDPSRAESMIEDGCLRLERGCNSCFVRYTECESREAVLHCPDGACLARVCKRDVVCTFKHCTGEGEQIDCDSRIARYSCAMNLRDLHASRRGRAGTVED